MRIAVGSYASKEQSGIQLMDFEPISHRVSFLSLVSGVERPSFIAVDPTCRYLFAVSEVAHGEVISYRYDRETDRLTELSRQSTDGVDPCYIQVHKSGRWVLGTNYTSGSIFVHPVSEDGLLGPMTQLITHEGRSVREDRQSSAHPHSIWNLPDTSYWIVPDLGADKLFIYAFDESVGQLTLQNEVATTPGAGPRHIAFHPTHRVLYVVQELSSSIAAFSYDSASGAIERIQGDVPMLPLGSEEIEHLDSTAADIHVSCDGLQVYASNRGHDSIAILDLQSDGRIVPGSLVTTPVGGNTPRNFLVVPVSQGDQSSLLVANQDSDNIVILEDLGDDSGRKSLAFQQIGESIPTIKPVCLMRIPE